jgi:hypothetical protein
MAVRRFPWGRAITLVALIAAAAVIGQVYGAEALKDWISITGVGLTGCVLWFVAGIRTWRAGGAESDSTARLERAAVELSAAVRRTWMREAAHRGLTSPLPIPVAIRPGPAELGSHPAQWAMSAKGRDDTAQLLTATATDVADLYARISTGRLVVLGGAGSGKTGLAVLLMLALHGRLVPGRVPVVFSLATWDPYATSVESWMTGQLVATYGAAAVPARELVDNGRVLPLLDGLDEMTPARRGAAIACLSALGTSPFVLTSRAPEYIDATMVDQLDATAVVELVPVDAATAAEYLARSGSGDEHRWAAVGEALRGSRPSPCQEVMTSPLMLSLARTIYAGRHTRPVDLLSYRTASELREHLGAGLVPAVYGRDPADVTPADALRWLRFFADHLPALGGGAIAWWRLRRCVSSPVLRLVGGTIAGLAAALWVFLLTWMVVPWARWYIGLAAGTLVALSAIATAPRTRVPSRWRRPRRSDLRQGLQGAVRPGLMVALGTAVASVAISATERGNESVLLDLVRQGSLDGMVFGAVVLTAVAITTAFSQQQQATVTPLSSFVTDCKAVIGAAATGTFVVGVAVCIAVVLADGNPPAQAKLAVALTLLTALGTLFWLGLWRCAAWWYLLSVALLARRQALPLRPLRFLEDAYRRGVLRRVGMTYEFRHAFLADLLRDLPR